MYFGAHNHTDYSNASVCGKDSITTIETLIDTAVNLGLKGVAITEHGIVSSHFNAIEYVKEGKENGSIPEDFTLGLGIESYLVDKEEVALLREQNEKIKFYHFIFIAKDEIGHRAIREIASRGFENSFNYRGFMRIPLYYSDLQEIISKYKGHVIASSACLGGFLASEGVKYATTQDMSYKNNIINFLNRMYKLFADDFYIELQPSHQEEQVLWNQLALNISKATGIKPIVSTDSHYPLKIDRKAHEILLLSSEGGDRELSDFYATTYLMSKTEVEDYLCNYISNDDMEQLFKNTLELSSKISEYSLRKTPEVALAEIPDGFELMHLFKDYYDRYEFIRNYAYSEYEVDRFFLSLIEKGFIDRKYTLDNEEAIKRINVELEQLWVISDKLKIRMSNYYCKVLEYIEVAWTISLVGVSRGSTGCFFILFLAGLTQLDGFKYNLPYFRHANTSRIELADVDTDFQASQKDNIIELLAEKYGRERILSICTFKTNGAKETILSTFRSLNLSDDKAHYLASLLGSEKAGSWSIRDSYYGNEKKDRKPVQAFINEVNKYKDYNLLNIMLRLEGLIVGRSAHAAATLLFNNHYNETSAMMKTAKGLMTTQFEMRNSEAMSNVKYDLLVTDALDRIRMTMNLLLEDGLMEWKGSLKETFNFYLHPDNIDMESEEIFKILYSGECISAFQMDTMVGSQALQTVKPMSFKEICITNNLMRLTVEGGEQPLNKFVRFRDSNNALWYEEMRENNLNDFEISVMEKHLKEKFGIADSQESVMLLSMDNDIAGFDLTEANYLRKSIGKKSAKILEEVRVKFFNKGISLGNRQEILNYVWKYCILPQAGLSVVQ